MYFIQVDDAGNLKLSGACIPRYAALPTTTEHPVADFVYLAPEVLKRELYIAQADVYGYGLLIYELVCERKAFKHERKMAFSDFVKKVDPEEMLKLSEEESEALLIRHRDLIRKCIDMDPQKRPKMAAVSEKLARHQTIRQSISFPVPMTPKTAFSMSKRMSLQ